MAGFGANCTGAAICIKESTTIESIGSSTRIEGSKLSDKEVEALLGNLSVQQFTSRDEQEVAGYWAVMNIIFESYEHIPLTGNYIQQLHAELLKYSGKDSWHRGQYKKSPNHVEAFDADGKSLGIVFETASPFETPLRMEQLITWVNQAYAEKKMPASCTAPGTFLYRNLELLNLKSLTKQAPMQTK